MSYFLYVWYNSSGNFLNWCFIFTSGDQSVQIMFLLNSVLVCSVFLEICVSSRLSNLLVYNYSQHSLTIFCISMVLYFFLLSFIIKLLVTFNVEHYEIQIEWSIKSGRWFFILDTHTLTTKISHNPVFYSLE